MSLNKVMLIGRLGADPEVKYMPSGGVVANFTIATSDTWKDKNSGERQERTEWSRIVAFNRLAEIVGEYLRKGAQVYVEGRIQTRKWKGQDGRDNYTTEIVISDLQMLDSRNAGNAQQSHYGNNQGAAPAPSAPAQQNNYANNANAAPVASNPPQSTNVAPSSNKPSSPPPHYDDFDDDIPF